MYTPVKQRTHVQPRAYDAQKRACQDEHRPHPGGVERGEERAAPAGPAALARAPMLLRGLGGEPVDRVALGVRRPRGLVINVTQVPVGRQLEDLGGRVQRPCVAGGGSAGCMSGVERE
jgi:hypothetical protein